MKFDKSLDWLKESDEDEIFGDELDDVKGDEEQINEVRYIDPSNVDKYDPSEIEEVTTASGEKRYKRKTGAQPSNQTVDKKEEPKQIDSLDDIPDRGKVDWLNVSTNDANSYNNTIHQLFNVDKRPDANHAENLMRMQIYNGLDGELIKEIKSRVLQMQSNPDKEVAQAIKQLDDSTKNKQFEKAGEAYVKLWDLFHN